MAKREKHKRNAMREWLEAEEDIAPAHSRSSHVLGAFKKVRKAVSRRVWRAVTGSQTQKVEPALAREPAPPIKWVETHSQPSSPEHLRKLRRLPRLRAPFSPNPAKASPGARG